MIKGNRCDDNLFEQEKEHKIPPHAVAAEQGVIAALMLDAQVWEKVVSQLTEEDFYQPAHQYIFKAIKKLADKQSPFDILTVSQKLDELGWVNKSGGLYYLGSILKEMPSSANVEAYVEIVREKSMLRQLISSGIAISDLAFQPQGRKVSELIDLAEQKIFSIANQYKKQTTGPRHIRSFLADAVYRIDMLYNTKDSIVGLSTGFSEFDKATTGLQAADLVIVAGRPSMGKTSFCINIAEHVAINEGLPVIVFSMEMPGEQLAMRMISSLGRIDLQQVRTGKLNHGEWACLTTVNDLLSETKLYIDDTRDMTPIEVRARCRRLAREHDGKLGLVMLDYLQLMRFPGAESRVNEISEISRSMKGLAKELNVPVLALSQLNRSLENRPNKRPMMSDLRESGAIEQDADLIAFIYRDEVYNKDSQDKGYAEIIIAKQRNGPLTTIKLAFLGHQTRFENTFQGSSSSGDYY